MTKKTQVFSIFGQIETVVAEAMIKEGKCNRIPADAIPPTAAFNNNGQSATLALVIPARYLAEYERRVRALYK